MQTHTPLSFAVNAGLVATTASLTTPDWRIVAVNGCITIFGAALAAWLKRTSGKRRKRRAKTPSENQPTGGK